MTLLLPMADLIHGPTRSAGIPPHSLRDPRYLVSEPARKKSLAMTISSEGFERFVTAQFAFVDVFSVSEGSFFGMEACADEIIA